MAETTTIEKRYIRAEDWEGNRYYFEGSGGAGGSTASGSEATEGDDGTITTDGTITSNTSSSTGKAIIVTSGASEKNAITADFEDLVFGLTALSLRLNSSIGSGTTNLLRIETYFVDNAAETETLLSTTYVTGDNIGTASKFLDIGFIFDYRGEYSSSFALRVKVIMLPDTNCTMYIDYLTVNKAFVGLTGNPTEIFV